MDSYNRNHNWTLSGCSRVIVLLVHIIHSYRSCQTTPLLPADGVWWWEAGHRWRHWNRDGDPVSLPTCRMLMLLFVCETQTHTSKLTIPAVWIQIKLAMQAGWSSLTFVQGSETELSISVQFLQRWRSGARMKRVMLLVPWSLIVNWQFALYIQVRHS